MKLDPQAKEAAHLWAIEATSDGGISVDDYINGILNAYLSALTPAEASGLVERLHGFVCKARDYAREANDDAMYAEADTLLEDIEAQAAELAEAKIDALSVGDQMLAEKFRADNLSASLASERAAHAETKQALDEARRRRDEWRRKAEGFDEVRLALREKVGSPWPPNMSRVLWAGIAADEKKRADDLEARLAEALKALEPFAEVAGDVWADDNGWTDAACQNDRICDWFGPSAFRAARRVREGGKSMVDAPETIWAYHNGNSQTYLTAPNKFHNVEYTRSDLVAELAAENERLKQEVENWKTSAAVWQELAKGDAEALASTGAVKEAGAKLAKAVFGVDLVAHPRATNTVDVHETANVSDKPIPPTTLIDTVSDEVWASDKSNENPTVIDRDKPEGQQEPVAWALMSKTAGALSTTIEKTVATKWKEQETLSGFFLAPLYTRPSEQAVTDEMVDQVLDAAGDYMGK